MEDIAEWAGHYKLKQKRQAALDEISKQRLETLPRASENESVRLIPAEPALTIG